MQAKINYNFKFHVKVVTYSTKLHMYIHTTKNLSFLRELDHVFYKHKHGTWYMICKYMYMYMYMQNLVV